EAQAELCQVTLGSLSQRDPYGIPSGPVGLRPESPPSQELPGGARQRQSVLRRRDRESAGRYSCARRRARQLPPCESALERRDPAYSAGGARRAYRRATRRREATAA